MHREVGHVAVQRGQRVAPVLVQPGQHDLARTPAARACRVDQGMQKRIPGLAFERGLQGLGQEHVPVAHLAAVSASAHKS